MKRSRSNNKDMRGQLKEAALCDRDLDGEVADEWFDVEGEKDDLATITPAPEEFKARQTTAKRPILTRPGDEKTCYVY